MNTIAIIKDFFDSAWLNKAKMFEKLQIHSDRWLSNHQFFPPEYVEGPGVVLINFVPSPFDLELAEYMVEKKWLKYRPDHFHVLLYRGCCGSFVNWHKDGKQDFTNKERAAISIYLTNEWKSSWGGWFSYKEDSSDIIHSYSPIYNSAVVLLKDVEHCTTPVSFSAPYPRTSIQLFFEKDALNLDYFEKNK